MGHTMCAQGMIILCCLQICTLMRTQYSESCHTMHISVSNLASLVDFNKG